jgi:hypothetical protein
VTSLGILSPLLFHSLQKRTGPLLRFWLILLFVLVLFTLTSCGGQGDARQEGSATLSAAETDLRAQPSRVSETATPDLPQLDLTLMEEDIVIEPLPLRAGFPFSITATVHNNGVEIAQDVPIMVYMSGLQEEIGYRPFMEVLTVTLLPSQSLGVQVPVNWNFAGGEHQLWVQVNRLPDAWQTRTPTRPEPEFDDNTVLLDLMVDPFDAYISDLCSGRVDVEIGPADVLPEPDRQRVMVRVHNVGNRAAYNLPVIVIGDQLTGITYTPAIPPCGGTVDVHVDVGRPLQQGETLAVQVNPSEWLGSLEEDNTDNNQVTVVAGLAPGLVVPPGSGLDDYDFSIATADIETPELWIVLVTVRNLGTRDASMVPIWIENEAGRKITDAIPLVQGNGSGVAAFRVGYLWTRGGTLTFTVNPQDAQGGYPESNRNNNTATFLLP